jgi:GT2 family glycosyltransferase
MKRYRPPLGEATLTPRPILPDVALVIPTLGRPVLEDCLHAVATGDAWPAEVVLVDQGMNAEVERWVAILCAVGLGVRHVRAPKRGAAAATNRGIEAVTVRFVVVTDDDCLPEFDWLSRMAHHLRESPEAIVTGRVEAAGDDQVMALTRSRVPRTIRRPLLKHDSMAGGNMGAHRSTLERVGPFDEDECLIAAQDCEYSYRALRRGVAITYAPDAVVRHTDWRDTGGRSSRYDAYARSYAGFLGKYLRQGDWFIALRILVAFARSSRRWLRGIVTGDAELAMAGRAYALGLLPGLIAGWRSRHRS